MSDETMKQYLSSMFRAKKIIFLIAARKLSTLI